MTTPTVSNAILRRHRERAEQIEDDPSLDRRARLHEAADRIEENADRLPSLRDCWPGALICLGALSVLASVALYLLHLSPS